MIFCEYGCGQPANYYFPTVNIHCCSDHWSRCPVKRKNMSQKLKGKTRSEESVSKQRKSMLGRKLTKEHKLKIAEAHKGKVLPDSEIKR